MKPTMQESLRDFCAHVLLPDVSYGGSHSNLCFLRCLRRGWIWSGDVQRRRWQRCRVCVPFCWAGLPVLCGYAVCFTVLRCCGSLLHIGLCDRYTLAHSKQNNGCRVSKVSHLWLRREGRREIARAHKAGGFLVTARLVCVPGLDWPHPSGIAAGPLQASCAFPVIGCAQR